MGPEIGINVDMIFGSEGVQMRSVVRQASVLQ